MVKAHNKMTRRQFLSVVTIACIGSLNSCGYITSYKRGELGKVLGGYSAFRNKNPYCRHRQIQTFVDNIFEHGPASAGSQYSIGHNSPIVATARGKVYRMRTRSGYHGLEDDVTIDHGGGFHTRYFHMKPNSSELSWGKLVNRGETLGLADRNIPFKTSMNYMGILGDMNDYGQKMGYMRYWDGIPIDHDLDEITRRSKSHKKLISELRTRYIGPGSEQLQKTNWHNIPTSLSYDKHGNYSWSYAMVFRMLEYIYDEQPNLFRGLDNDQLITEIYDSQPVVFTLPFPKKDEIIFNQL